MQLLYLYNTSLECFLTEKKGLLRKLLYKIWWFYGTHEKLKHSSSLTNDLSIPSICHIRYPEQSGIRTRTRTR